MALITSPSVKSASGFTLIDLLFTCSLIGLISTLAIPGLMRARGVAQSASAVGTLRVINSAQLSFAVTCGSGFYSADLQTLGVKPPAAYQAFLTPEMTAAASFIKQGYNFSMTGTSFTGAPPTCNGASADFGSPGYVAIADPLDQPGNPHFYGTNADGTIYEDTSTFSLVMPESGPSLKGVAIH
jgi:type IV pilus assembly protein PilA